MDENTLPPVEQADPGTATWQPETIAVHQASISSFLDAQFAFPPVRLAAERTLELLDLSLGHSVLDVGCGNGTFLALLGSVVGAQGRAVGVDPAPAFVAEARERIAAEGLGGCVTVEEGDAYRLPFDDNSFDAARCERVLMHLDDPVAAIREMRRVVRPGGRVVATEPDWAGSVMDHPDPDALALLYNGFLRRFRQPRMGRTLYRRFSEAGLVDRDVTLIPAVITDVDFLQQSGLDLSSQVEEIVAARTLSRERAEAAATYFESANKDGLFFSSGTYFIVSGSVPTI